NTNAIEQALFGECDRFDEERLELRQKLQSRQVKDKPGRPRAPSWAVGPLQIFGNHRKSASETGGISRVFRSGALRPNDDIHVEDRGPQGDAGPQHGPTITDVPYPEIPPDPPPADVSGIGRSRVGRWTAVSLIAVGATAQLWNSINRWPVTVSAPTSSVP